MSSKTKKAEFDRVYDPHKVCETVYPIAPNRILEMRLKNEFTSFQHIVVSCASHMYAVMHCTLDLGGRYRINIESAQR